MKVKLDKNGYFTGSYAEIGDLEGSIETAALPAENDTIKRLSYQYKGNNTWEFDEERYQFLLKQSQAEEISLLGSQMIIQSRHNLSNFLRIHKLKSSCHGGIEKEYSVTAEKQQYLNYIIAVTDTALQSSGDYKASWNASGEESTSDWTLDELKQLAVEIEAFIRPYVLRQQQIETAIKNAATLEELEAIDICFG